MAISYEDALATLQSMFSSQGYTAQQLDAVLRHQGGHMENTVQILLNHGDESPEALMQKLPMLPSGGGGGGSSADAPSMDADERLARQLAAEFERQPRISARAGGTATTTTMQTNHRLNEFDPAFRTPISEQQHQPISTTQSASGTNKGRGLPTVLPSDFLRIPGTKYPVSSPNAIISNARPGPTGASTMGQMMTDEQLARMLQDELFQEELRNNPEFSHLAGRRNPRADHFTGGSSGQMTGRSTYGGAGGGGGGIGERNDFFDRLSELGDTAKRRLEDLAARWRESNGPRHRFGGAAVGGTSPLPIRNERRGLLSDDLNMDDEEEMDFVGGSGNSGRDFEMNDVGSGDKKKD